MSGLANPFSRQRPPGFSERLAEIKAWTRIALALGDEIVVSVNELACSQPDCPPKETVILVLPKATHPLKFSVHKSLLDIVASDITEAARAAVTVQKL